MAEAVAEPIEVKKKKRSLGKLLLLVINILLCASGAAFFILTKLGIMNSFLPATSPAVSIPSVQEKQKMTSPEEIPQAELVAMRLRPFVINLSGDGGRRFLRVVLELDVHGDKAKEQMEERQSQIRDRLIFLLSSKTFEDINTMSGKYQLQAEIGASINELLGAPLVAKTYFTEFIVQ